MSNPLTIGQLARRTGTKAETIRYYERIGLLAAPSRSGGNYRHYAPDATRQLAFVRRARELGFSIGQVRELLGLATEQDADCTRIDEVARTHVEAIEHKIRDLRQLKTELERMIGSCPGGRVSDCRVLDALSGSTEQAP